MSSEVVVVMFAGVTFAEVVPQILAKVRGGSCVCQDSSLRLAITSTSMNFFFNFLLGSSLGYCDSDLGLTPLLVGLSDVLTVKSAVTSQRSRALPCNGAYAAVEELTCQAVQHATPRQWSD